MINAIRRGIVRTVAAALLLAALVALPAALVLLIGWPLPDHLPTTHELSGWLTSPIGDEVILDLLAIAAWLLWAAFIPAVATEIAAARRGLPTPASTGRTSNPLRLTAAALVTAITLGTFSITGTAAMPTVTASPSATAVQTVQTGQDGLGQLVAWSTAPTRRGPATFEVGSDRYSHVVDRGDTLSAVARDWLGDAGRWPEICQLNWHRHWPDIGGRLTDCDLIYPGWTLRLPDDAVPPSGAVPATSAPDRPPSSSSPTPGPSPQRTPEPSAAPTLTSPTASPSTAGQASSSAPAPSTTSPTAASASSPTGDEAGGSGPADATDEAPAPAGQDGVTLPGGFVPWSLAAAIAAAVALVWLQRRRRHRPGLTDDDPTDLPEPVVLLQREVTRHPDLPTDPDLAERAAQVPDQVTFPPGGLGLVGEGAHAAARAALVAVLATGGPRDPDRRAEAIIDGPTLSTLIGVDAATLGPWPRLHVADHFGHALALVDELLLHRARLLDENAARTVAELREKAPSEEPLPPVLLITESPSAGARMRMKTALSLGADVDLTAILLDTWVHGPTVHVDTDGHATCSDGPLPHGLPPRLGVLDTDTAVAVLATLREAHTGQRPSIAPHASPSWRTLDAPPSPRPDDDRAPHAGDPSVASSATDDVEPDIDEPAVAPPDRTPASPGTKARLRVLGTPDVLDVVNPGKPLRSKAAELAVFLACHPDGADIRAIGDDLEPGVRLRDADVRIHTNVHNLRNYFGRATGPRRMGYVLKTAGKYRLDPTAVDVDLWELRSLLTQAVAAPPDRRIDLLRRACALTTAPLAAGCDYEWIEPHRERARQQASEAHLLLAEALLPTQPQEVADLLDHAIQLDPYNEDLYKLAMHAWHALGDRDSIRDLLRKLTIAMADLDAEPDDETIELAQRLRTEPTRGRGDGQGQ